MNILVTRHGETDWNLLKKIQGRIDNDLNEKGKNQARETKEKLKDEKIDLIICSPLKRTRQLFCASLRRCFITIWASMAKT